MGYIFPQEKIRTDAQCIRQGAELICPESHRSALPVGNHPLSCPEFLGELALRKPRLFTRKREAVAKRSPMMFCGSSHTDRHRRIIRVIFNLIRKSLHAYSYYVYLAAMSKSFKRHLTPSPESNRKPRFFVREHHGQLQLVIRLALEVEDVQALQNQLSRGVVAALIRDITEIVNPPRRINPKTP